MNSKNLIKLAKKNGWCHARTKGSHHIFTKQGHIKNIAIPHPKKDFKKGILNQIIKQIKGDDGR